MVNSYKAAQKQPFFSTNKLLVLLLFLSVLLFQSCAIFSSSYKASADVTSLKSELEAKGLMTYTDGVWELLPRQNSQSLGLIFYPGGKVDPLSYLSMLSRLRDGGIAVFLVKMPLDLAVFNNSAADAIMENHPEINNWVIAGHSLGGAMACSYVEKNSDKVKSLVLLAAYPAESTDLSIYENLNVLSISAENDGLATQDKIAAMVSNLPDDTDYIVIQGGNHAQFGDYGIQADDGVATISQKAQEKIVVHAILNFLYLK